MMYRVDPFGGTFIDITNTFSNFCHVCRRASSSHASLDLIKLYVTVTSNKNGVEPLIFNDAFLCF